MTKGKPRCEDCHREKVSKLSLVAMCEKCHMSTGSILKKPNGPQRVTLEPWGWAWEGRSLGGEPQWVLEDTEEEALGLAQPPFGTGRVRQVVALPPVMVHNKEDV